MPPEVSTDRGSSAHALRAALLFYASFDGSLVADVAGGGRTLGTRFGPPAAPAEQRFEPGFDPRIFRHAPGRGISGGALEVVDVLPENGRVFYPARGNLAIDGSGWGGALSVWCLTDPNRMLKTTFCDPIQITQNGANNGGLWVDFNNASPRDFRHGAFPAATAGQKPIAEDAPDAPLVRVPAIDWRADQWRHILFSWSRFDTGRADALSQLYIDGQLIGEIRDRPLAMQWDPDRTGVYVAVNYIGLLDELAIFRRPLAPAEVELLWREPGVMKGAG